MPKVMYNPDGVQVSADDEQVEILLNAGYTSSPPEKEKAKKHSEAKSSNAKEDTVKVTKKIKKKKI